MTRRNPPVHTAGPDPDQITMPGVRPATLSEMFQCLAHMPRGARAVQQPIP